MKEFIESIIEIVLEDVSCEHQEDSDGAGRKYDDVSYWLKNQKAVMEKCIEAIPARLIERPEITVEFMEKKTTELHDKLWPAENCLNLCRRQVTIREFLSSLLNELAAKISLLNKPEVNYKIFRPPGRDKSLDVKFVAVLEDAIRCGVGEKDFLEGIIEEYKKPEENK